MPLQMRETGTQGGEIDFLQYLASVERTQLTAFLSTNIGKAQLAKLGKKLTNVDTGASTVSAAAAPAHGRGGHTPVAAD